MKYSIIKTLKKTSVGVQFQNSWNTTLRFGFWMLKKLKNSPCYQYYKLMLIYRRRGVLLSETVSRSLWLFSLGLPTAVTSYSRHITKPGLIRHLPLLFHFPWDSQDLSRMNSLRFVLASLFCLGFSTSSTGL